MSELRTVIHAAEVFRKPVPARGVPAVYDGYSDAGDYGWFLGRISVDDRKQQEPRIWKSPYIFYFKKEDALKALEDVIADPEAWY